MFPCWLSNLAKWASRKRQFTKHAPRLRRGYRPVLEQFEGRIVPSVGPFVQSINRTAPTGTIDNSSSVTYTLTFSEPVTGVDPADFELALSSNVTGAVTQVTPATGAVYTVTVSGISGNGKLGLNLLDNGSIHDLAGNLLTQSNAPASFQSQATYATGTGPRGIAAADLNGDGFSDLIVVNRGSNSISVLLGNGDGTFQKQSTYATGLTPNFVAVADVNGDSIPDLIVINNRSFTASVLLGNGNGTFQSQHAFATGRYPDSVAVADFNGDGKPDLAVANYTANSVSLLLGNGNGTFQTQSSFATSKYPNDVVATDVNGDGKPDLVVVNLGSNTVGVLLDNGNGTFQAQSTFTAGSAPKTVTVADVNGDGVSDIIVPNFNSNNVSVLLGNGNGTFQGQSLLGDGSHPSTVAVADVNGDGIADLVVGNNGGNSVGVFLGNGNGTFQSQHIFSTSLYPLGVSVADFNGDGKPDVAVAGYGSPSVSVLLNSVNGNFTGQIYTILIAPYLAVSMPSSVAAGSAATITVAAYDVSGNPLTGYTGTVHFKTTDPSAAVALPADYTFVSGDNGVHVFTGSATLATVGSQTVTATDTASNAISGSTAVSVNAVPWPFVQSINRTSPLGPVTGATSVTYTVVFSKPVTGVVPADFQLALTGSLAATVSQITPATSSVYAVTVGGITGTGTVGLNLVDNASIRDLAGNPLTQSNAGVSFQNQTTYATGVNPRQAVVADVNGDGIPDVVVVNSGSSNTVGLLMGNGNGTFQNQVALPTGNHPVKAAVADLNGDGSPDLVVVNNGADTVGIILHNGNGTFQNQTYFSTGYHPAEVAVADVNGDGKPDLIVTNYLSNTVSVLLGNGNGTFQSQTTFAAGTEPYSVAAVDLNGDGKLDLVVANYQSNNVSVLLGNGDGTFQSQTTLPTGTGPNSVAVADLNGDGKPDLIVANEASSSVGVLLGNGNGTFQNQVTFAAALGCASVAVADVNGDGKLDLVVANYESNNVSILLGNGNGTFQNPKFLTTGANPIFLSVADVNGDGRPDIVVANSLGNNVSVLLNAASGTFTGQVYTIVAPTGQFAISGAPTSVTAGTPFSFTVTALASNNVPVTSYTGTVHFTISDTGTGAVVPADYTFTAADNGVHVFTSRTTLVTAANQTVTATDTSNAAITGTTPVIVNPATTTTLAVIAPSTATAGTPFSLTVTALDSFGNRATGYTGTVHFAVNDIFATPPANGTLNSGIGTFTATLRTAGSRTLTAADTVTNTIAGVSANIALAAATVNHLAISAPSSTTAAASFAFTVTAQDAFYNTVPGYSGTVHFVSSDPSAALPPDTTLAGGTGTFNGTFNMPGSQTIRAYDVAANSITGSSGTVAVSATATHFVIGAPTSTAAGSIFVFTVTAKDALGGTVTGYSGIVRFTSNDAQALFTSSTSTLTGGVGFFAANLRTAGSQSLTVTDTVNSALSGTSANITVSAAAATHLGLSTPATAITGIAFPFTVTALDPFNNLASTYNGTVHFISTDPAATVPANATLTAGVGTFTAMLAAPGSQSITATDLTAQSGIAGTSAAIASRGLEVASFSLTPSGFVAIFNKPFDPSTINLYDTSGTLGPDDVTLTGPNAPATSFHGSLLIDPTDTTISFVKTSTFTSAVNSFNPQTGVLPAGTYTVTFRSAADGFKDLTGSPLDGAANGNPAGSNYVTTFVVSATPAEVVGIPGFARGPDSTLTVNLPNNQTGGIPINLSNGANVTSGTFTLQYNSALLTITGATMNSALTGATLVLDGSSTPGNAVIDFTSPTALAPGVIRLGGLVAIVPNAAASFYKAKALLHFSSLKLNGGAIAATPDDAVQVVAYFGDANGDGSLSGGDGALISRVATAVDDNPAAGIIGGFAAYQLADPTLVGNLTNSGNVSAADVTLINSYLAGTSRAQLPLIPKALTLPPTGPDPTLSLPANVQTTAGGTVIVPVNIDTARPAGSSGMMEAILALRFDPNVFTVSPTDIAPGTLTNAGEPGTSVPGFWQLQTSINCQTGEIGIDLFGSTPIQTTAGGSLVTITMHVRDNAPVGSTGINLVNSVTPIGQRTYATTMSDALGAFVLHPATTPLGTEPGTPGSVTVEQRAVGSERWTVSNEQWAVPSGLLTVAGGTAFPTGSRIRLDHAFGALEDTAADYAPPAAYILEQAFEDDDNPTVLSPLTTGYCPPSTAEPAWVPADLAAYHAQVAKAVLSEPLGENVQTGIASGPVKGYELIHIE